MKLVACQSALLDQNGSIGGYVKRALRMFGFAKQRFDSMTDPQRKWCYLVLAIALLLCWVITDTRKDEEKRAIAEQLLNEMDPNMFIAAGLSGDYNEECLRWLRRVFDVNDHDPANTCEEVSVWKRRVRELFQNGHCFALPEGTECTCLQIIFLPIEVSTHQVLFWGRSKFPRARSLVPMRTIETWVNMG